MLDGKVALVTGATRGIGKAIARALARDGATVVGTATTDEGAATIAAYLLEAGNAGQGIRLDVTDAERGRRGHRTISSNVYGDIAILVNNAGITRDNLLAAHEGRRVGRDHGHESQVRVSVVEGGAARDDEGALRPHHQHRLGGRRQRQCGADQLRRGKGGAGRIHQIAGAGGRQPRRSPSIASRPASSTPT